MNISICCFQRPDSCCLILPAMIKVETLRECNIGDLYGENHPETPPVCKLLIFYPIPYLKL